MTRSLSVRRVSACTAVLAVVLGITACTSSAKKHTAAPAPSTTSASPTPTPTTSTPKKPVARNPLTGLPGVPKAPLIAVKIDDTAPGRPQVNIDKADIVYLEAVEGGLTRLAALFGTNKPTVGYVRSTRPSDPDLLRQYGKITEAFSGGQKVSRNILDNAGLHGWDLGAGVPYFYRVVRPESDYINVKLDLAALAKHVKTNAPKSNGWTFNPSLTGLTTTPAPAMNTVVTGSYATGTPVSFHWDATLKRYVRYIDGVRQHAADGNAVSATNVVVLSCKIVSFPQDKDVNGNPAQFTYTIGTGTASVFRQGRRIDGTWTRAKAADGTTLRTAAGKAMPLAPGNTWVVLVRNGIAVHS
jgi:Protein of unknown function (DUF3048) N-terminal domain/Protein of unknown function (DUF3048) C-terminal domain